MLVTTVVPPDVFSIVGTGPFTDHRNKDRHHSGLGAVLMTMTDTDAITVQIQTIFTIYVSMYCNI